MRCGRRFSRLNARLVTNFSTRNGVDCYRKCHSGGARPLLVRAPGAPDSPARVLRTSLPQRETPNAVRLLRKSHVRTGLDSVTCGLSRHGGPGSYIAGAEGSGRSAGYNSTAPDAGRGRWSSLEARRLGRVLPRIAARMDFECGCGHNNRLKIRTVQGVSSGSTVR